MTPSPLSYVHPQAHGPWQTYLSQVDRVLPYLGHLARWGETLKRPKRALIVDVPIELDNGTVAHFEGYRVQHSGQSPRCCERGGRLLGPGVVRGEDRFDRLAGQSVHERRRLSQTLPIER